MMNHPDFYSTDLSSLKVAGVGGAPCAEAILRTWSDRGVSMIQNLGMTEKVLYRTEDAEENLGSAGKPLHTEVKELMKDRSFLGRGRTLYKRSKYHTRLLE